MAAYGPLHQIKDPAAQSLLRQVIDQLSSLSGRLDGGPSWKTNINAGGFQVTNSSDGIEDGDLTTLRQVEGFLLSEVLKERLEAGGDAELNVSGLVGRLGEPQQMGVVVIPDADSLPNVTSGIPYEVVSWQGKLWYFSPLTNPGAWVPLTAAASIIADTHANRLTLYLPANQSLGTMFWETDRTALYYITSAASVKSWTLMLTRPLLTTSVGRPADLGTADTGFLITVSDFGHIQQRWSGTAWQYWQGIYSDTFANRPAVADSVQGMRFRATDYGFQTWRSTGAAWVIEEGVGGPMRGTIIAVDQRPVGLTTNDTGFRFEATDAGITFRWLFGTGWVVQPNQILAGSLSMAAAQTIATATTTTVTFGTTVVDQGPIVSGNTFVVPANCGGTPSVWCFRAEVEWDGNATGTRRLDILRNGVAIGTTIVTPAATDTHQETNAIDFNVNVGDAYSVSVVQTSGGNLDIETGTFKGYRMSPNG